ncbi:hypothetical protein FISHEDRAFT_62669 [Fistulina hepatica ATCC 64428]|nr:hypothetical protein FISHEDRAFT_62669 [Fistulina hepatica ATCC 64428]
MQSVNHTVRKERPFLFGRQKLGFKRMLGYTIGRNLTFHFGVVIPVKNLLELFTGAAFCAPRVELGVQPYVHALLSRRGRFSSAIDGLGGCCVPAVCPSLGGTPPYSSLQSDIIAIFGASVGCGLPLSVSRRLASCLTWCYLMIILGTSGRERATGASDIVAPGCCLRALVTSSGGMREPYPNVQTNLYGFMVLIVDTSDMHIMVHTRRRIPVFTLDHDENPHKCLVPCAGHVFDIGTIWQGEPCDDKAFWSIFVGPACASGPSLLVHLPPPSSQNPDYMTVSTST